MNRPTRRALLRGGGACGAILVAGCLADSPTDSGAETETDANADVELEYEVYYLEGGATGDWWDEEDGPTGLVERLESPDDESRMPDSEDAHARYDETDFETESVLYLESVGPNTCIGPLEVLEIRIDDGVLTGEAVVIEESPDDNGEEEMMACGQAITYSSTFVRIAEETLPENVAIEITDGWGETETVEADSHSVDPDESEPVESTLANGRMTD